MMVGGHGGIHVPGGGARGTGAATGAAGRQGPPGEPGAFDRLLEVLAGGASRVRHRPDSGSAEPASALPPDPTLERVAPELRRRLARVVERMAELGHDVRVLEGYRTQARQDALWRQGRTAPGPVVTWTRSSLHTEGRAVDVQVNATWRDPAGYAALQRIAAEEGLGTLGMRDPGHLELPEAVATGWAETPRWVDAAARPADPDPAAGEVGGRDVEASGATGRDRMPRPAPVAEVAPVGVPAPAAVAAPAAVTRPARPGGDATSAREPREPAGRGGRRGARHTAASSAGPGGSSATPPAAAGRAPEGAPDGAAFRTAWGLEGPGAGAQAGASRGGVPAPDAVDAAVTIPGATVEGEGRPGRERVAALNGPESPRTDGSARRPDGASIGADGGGDRSGRDGRDSRKGGERRVAWSEGREHGASPGGGETLRSGGPDARFDLFALAGSGGGTARGPEALDVAHGLEPSTAPERVAEIRALQDRARAPGRLHLDLPDLDGDGTSLRMRLRGARLDATLEFRQADAADRARARVGELHEALERAGLDPERLSMRSSERSGADTSSRRGSGDPSASDRRDDDRTGRESRHGDRDASPGQRNHTTEEEGT